MRTRWSSNGNGEEEKIYKVYVKLVRDERE